MPFQTINTGSQPLQQIQRNITQAINVIESKPFQGGNLLTGVSLAVGANSIPHKLGRQLQIWVIADINAAPTLYKTSADTKFLNLQCSAQCVVSLWVA